MTPAFGTLRICEDAADLARKGAAFLCDHAASRTGRTVVALSGGNTPKPLYELLAREPAKSTMPWDRVHWIMGDERFVPPSDPASNYGMARAAFLSHVPVPPENVHPVETGGVTLDEAARDYETVLQGLYGAGTLQPGKPLLDITLLGLGDDGHTASLLPHEPVLQVRDRWVAAVPKGRVEERITLTYPAINASEIVAFLVSGEGKREILDKILSGDDGFPASHVRARGQVLWFADRAAAGRWA
ncbi:6-phosphogluconolactonase [Methyloceanibacter sp.]|uniref:6-phosphogluconolactonase n=1 Tax=Methyloceanibacter sp. TaxID=1965321 RepID=UPI002BA9573E|nr:6-phosphogluconolactonase [Methyloceanibacter sp.]HML92392.1 6-phosphogluconolactonase [Methyloceanibacter sp.]